MGTAEDHKYVIPPRYWAWVAHPRVLRALCWLVAIGCGIYHIHHAREWLADDSCTHEMFRRPTPGGQGHTQIDFGGQWVMGRMLVSGYGRELYHRQRQWDVVRAGFPQSEESPVQRDESILPKNLRIHAKAENDLNHDADRMMGWFMGYDPPAWKTVGGAAAAPLAADLTGNPFAALALEQAAAEAVTRAVEDEVSRPAVGGPLYPPVHAFIYAPLGLLDHPRDAYFVFQFVALGMAYLAGLAISRLTGGRVWWSVASTGVLFYPGFRAGIDLGQNPTLSLCVVLWGWVLVSRNREWAGGAVWGLFAFKPVWGLAFFLVPLLMGRWRVCLAMVGTGAALGALTLPVVGLRAWFDWLQVGTMAADLYTHNENWINLSRDLQGLPRRFLLDFTVPDAERDTPRAKAAAWTLWGVVFAGTVLVYLLRADRRRRLGLGAAFLFLGAFLSCYRFMYYDIMLSLAGIACLLAGGWELFRPRVFGLTAARQLPGGDLAALPSDPLGPRLTGVVNSFPLTVLAALYLVENVLVWLGIEATVGVVSWAGVATAADGSTAFATPRVHADTTLHYPWDTALVLLLWAWCGVRLLLGGERAVADGGSG